MPVTVAAGRPYAGRMLIGDHLDARTRRDGAAPLLTHYDLEDRSGTGGSRTELSAVTFANWVAKAANLIVDELDLDAGDAVALPLLRTHPEHWMSLVWIAACWRTGVEVRLEGTEVTVVGPEALAEPARWPGTVLACSLHPLGLGFREALPAGWLDWSAEVRSQPDQFVGVDPTPDLPAWDDGEQTLDQAALAAGEGRADRVVVRPGAPWSTVRDALVAPLLGGGSSVLVTGGGTDDLARIATAERVG